MDRNTHRKAQPSWFSRDKPQGPAGIHTECPSPAAGYAIIVCSILFLLIGSYAVLFSAFFPTTGIWLLDALAADTHYKYLPVMLIGSGTAFVISNWVGWQYYRYS